MTENLVSQTSISEDCCVDAHEATCHAAKDHAVQPRKWDYSFNVD
jgi:hypothetical protein